MGTTDVTAPRPTVARHRLAVGMLMAGAAVLVLAHDAYQTAEITLSGVVLQLFGSSQVYVAAGQQTVYFGLDTCSPLGLHMTPECTSAFLLVPLVVVSAGLIALRPAITRRLLFSLAVAGITLIAVNQLRILTVANLVDWLGTDRGYYWGHTMVGSLVSVLGAAVALVLFLWLATRPGPPPAAEEPQPARPGAPRDGGAA